MIIAFEQPWALDWQLRMAKDRLEDVQLLVFDNSRNPALRPQIQAVCARHRIPCFALPKNNTRHANRSHGLAMSWVYYNVVRKLAPRTFGFLDHDLIPVRQCGVPGKIRHQPFYGMINQGKFGFWSLWAGYCFFDYASVQEKPLNFLYDFSRDLDTGGRNWHPLYSAFERDTLAFARNKHVLIRLDSAGESRRVQLVDENWLHIGGISYNNNFEDKFRFFECLAKELEEGRPWSSLLASAPDSPTARPERPDFIRPG